MKYAYIDNGVLRDVVMSHPSQLFMPGYASKFVEVPDHVFNDWTFDGTDYFPPVPPSPVIPQVVTMRQARLVLLRHGYLATVDAAIAQIGGEAQIEWEYAHEVRRDSNLVVQMGALLSLDDAALDALFVEASSL